MKIGIAIPYYENSKEMRERFQFLLDILFPQLKDNFVLAIAINGKKECKWLMDYEGNKNLFLHYEPKPNVSRARNVCMDLLSDCDYITFLDADDSISCDYLELGYKACLLNKYDVITSRLIWNGYETWGTRDNRKKLLTALRGSVTGAFYRNEFIKDIKFDEHLQIGEDLDFKKQVKAKEPVIGVFDGIYVYNKGVNPESLVMRYERKEIEEYV